MAGSAPQVLFFKDLNGTVTCPEANEFPGVGVGAAVGVMCSGRGECIEGKCVCEFGWSGVSDFYDLNGLDCHSPRIFEQVLWSLTVASWVYLTYLNFFAWRYQKGLLDVRNKESKSKGEFLAWYLHLPTRFLFLHLIITCPTIIVLGLLKITTNQAFGVDVPISFFLCLGQSSSFMLLVGPDAAVLRLFTAGIKKSNSLQRAFEHANLAYEVCTGIYAVCIWIIVFLPIMLPGVFNGSSGTPRAADLIVRNLVTSIQLFATASATRYITVRATETIAQVRGNARDGDKLQLILAQLKTEVSNVMRKTFAGTLLYVVFSIPQLWGYFSYSLAFMLIFFAGRNHTVHWYLPKGRMEGINKQFGTSPNSPTASNNDTTPANINAVAIENGSKIASVEPSAT